jgi:hypothetical protein
MTDEELIRAMQERKLLDDDQVEELLERLARTDDQWEGTLKRLLTLETQLDRLTRHTNPVDFATWLQHRKGTGQGAHHLQHLLDLWLPGYIAWLQRLVEAYHQATPPDVFADLLTTGEEHA